MPNTSLLALPWASRNVDQIHEKFIYKSYDSMHTIYFLISVQGRFNNYVTLKLPFLTPPTASRYVTFAHETVVTLSWAISRISATSWWSYILPTSSEDATFQEHVLKTHFFNIRIQIRIFEYNSNIWIQFKIQT